MNKHNYYSYLISIYIMLMKLNIRKDQKLIKMHLIGSSLAVFE